MECSIAIRGNLHDAMTDCLYDSEYKLDAKHENDLREICYFGLEYEVSKLTAGYALASLPCLKCKKVIIDRQIYEKQVFGIYKRDYLFVANANYEQIDTSTIDVWLLSTAKKFRLCKEAFLIYGRDIASLMVDVFIASYRKCVRRELEEVAGLAYDFMLRVSVVPR